MRAKQFCAFCGNKLEIRYLEARNRLFCPNCQSINYENPLPAAAAVVFNDKHELLLVKRKVEPRKGDWCLPGGFAELDEVPEAACLRELKEETGLKGRIERLIDIVLSPSPEYKAVYVIGYLVCDFSGTLHAGDDSEEAAFFALTRRPPLAFKSHEFLLSKAISLISSDNFDN